MFSNDGPNRILLLIEDSFELSFVFNLQLLEHSDVVLVLNVIFEEDFILNLELVQLELLLSTMSENVVRHILSVPVSCLLEKQHCSGHNHAVM